LFARRALDYHWIVAKCFQLRLGFTLDGPDLLSGVVLCVLSILKYCTNFGKLIVTKNIKIVATRCQKCSQFDFDFSWGSVPVPAGGAYSAPSDPPLVGKGWLPSSHKLSPRLGPSGLDTSSTPAITIFPGSIEACQNKHCIDLC